MNYENEQKIEELLNGFIDGELSPTEHAEVRQLLDGNPHAARRLKEIERCRILVNSLPPAEPPAEVVSAIKQLIGRQIGRTVKATEIQRGSRQLFVRHLLAASVLVGLLGILAAVIFEIAGPTPINNTGVKSPVASDQPAISPTETLKAADDDAGIGEYSLRLQTADFTGVDAFVRKLLSESTWLKYEAKKEGPGRSTYRVLCSKAALEALMTDLAAVWSKFDSATLIVQTDAIGRPVEVDEVRPEQITEIAKQDTTEERIRLAKDFTALNGIERITPERIVSGLTDKTYPELLAIPKPVLTSGEKGVAAAPKGATDQVRVDLSIIVNKH